jgi:hypothetical protein
MILIQYEYEERSSYCIGAERPPNIDLTCNGELARAMRKEHSDSHGA